MIKLNTWAVFDKENEEYPGYYFGRLFKWHTPTDECFLSSDIKDVRQWVADSSKNNGNKSLRCLNPPPKPFPNLLEIWS